MTCCRKHRLGRVHSLSRILCTKICECSHCPPHCTSYTLATTLLRIFQPSVELSLLWSGNAGPADVHSGCLSHQGPWALCQGVLPYPGFVVNISILHSFPHSSPSSVLAV